MGGALLVAAITVVGTVTDHGPSRPADWDPRVADLVQFVQDERGLLYDHPVPIDFLTPDQYSDAVRNDEALSDADKKGLDSFEAELRALGLVGGDVDLAGSLGTLNDSGTLAFYDFNSQRVVVRGTEMTPDLRVTLVHELTHALQDQHFHLGQLASLDDQGEAGFRGLVEGDATRIENKYIDSMSAADRAEYQKESARDSSDADATLSGVPPVLLAYFGAPYSLGTDMVDLIEASGGNKAVNAAFDRPPSSEADLLDPFRFLAQTMLDPVVAPKLETGEKKVDEGDVGPIAIFFLLAAQFDAHDALHAADAWNGDAFVAFTRDGRTCLRDSIATVDLAGANSLRSLLNQWAQAAPERDAKVSLSGRYVTFESCDPGTNGSSHAAFDVQALALPVVRSEVGIGVVRGGAPPKVASCVAGKVVDSYSLADLTADDTSQFESQAFVDQVTGFAHDCGGG